MPVCRLSTRNVDQGEAGDRVMLAPQVRRRLVARVRAPRLAGLAQVPGQLRVPHAQERSNDAQRPDVGRAGCRAEAAPARRASQRRGVMGGMASSESVSSKQESAVASVEGRCMTPAACTRSTLARLIGALLSARGDG